MTDNPLADKLRELDDDFHQELDAKFGYSIAMQEQWLKDPGDTVCAYVICQLRKINDFGGWSKVQGGLVNSHVVKWGDALLYFDIEDAVAAFRVLPPEIQRCNRIFRVCITNTLKPIEDSECAGLDCSSSDA